jgi:hypothetical protein
VVARHEPTEPVSRHLYNRNRRLRSGAFMSSTAKSSFWLGQSRGQPLNKKNHLK